jgi:hypothetical protein
VEDPENAENAENAGNAENAENAERNGDARIRFVGGPRRPATSSVSSAHSADGWHERVVTNVNSF